MLRRQPIPAVGGWAFLEDFIEEPSSCAPIRKADVPDLLRVVGPLAKRVAERDHRSVAVSLSGCCIFLVERRLWGRPPTRREAGSRLQHLCDAAELVLGALAPGAPALFGGVFDPDIAHAHPVRAAFGIERPAALDRDSRAAKDAARDIEATIHNDLPEHLGLLLAIIREQQSRHGKSPLGRGRQVDWIRHDFTRSFIGAYQGIFGREAKVSRPPGGGPRRGPAPRLLAATCALFRSRLLPEEMAADPGLEPFLARAEREAAAWIEEARRREEELQRPVATSGK